MKKPEIRNNKLSSSRRDFVKGMLVAGGAATVAAASSAAAAEIADTEEATEAERGYHVTQHIRDYYRTAGM